MINYKLSDKGLTELQKGFWGDFFDFMVNNDQLDDLGETIGSKIVFAANKRFEDGRNRLIAVDVNRKWYLFVEESESNK